MYRDLGVKKGYWKRVRGSLEDYVHGRLAFDQVVTAISEEPRARGEALWQIFTSTRFMALNPAQTRCLDRLEARCVSLGFLPSREA